MSITPQCVWCKRLTVGDRTKPMQCEAFPVEIPRAILLREADHKLPYPGDGGLRYDPVPGAPE